MPVRPQRFAQFVLPAADVEHWIAQHGGPHRSGLFGGADRDLIEEQGSSAIATLEQRVDELKRQTAAVRAQCGLALSSHNVATPLYGHPPSPV
jgi:hypothetical protein